MAEFDPFARFDETVIVNPVYEGDYQGEAGYEPADTGETYDNQEESAWLRKEVDAYYEEIIAWDGISPGNIDYTNFIKDTNGKLAVKMMINGIMTEKKPL